VLSLASGRYRSRFCIGLSQLDKFSTPLTSSEQNHLFTQQRLAMRDPFTAGILSLLIPGVGQLYNGRILAGILWLIITPGFWIGSGGTLGWICHIIAAYTAYSFAKDHPVRT
jgi:TM2 domain-containing membrane protein YozV